MTAALLASAGLGGCADHTVQDTSDVAGSIGAQLQLHPGINLD
jgi:hypothetical protein